MRIALLPAVMISAAWCHADQIHEFEGIFYGSPYYPPQPEAVSADGSTVVGDLVEPIDDQGNVIFNAFRWTESEGTVNLERRPNADSTAVSVSGDGSVVVGYDFRWTAQTGMVIFDDQLPGYDHAFRGWDISRDGSVIVGFVWRTTDFGGQACRWTADGGLTGLGFPAGYGGGVARAVSADGSVVAGTVSKLGENAQDAAVWSADGSWDVLGIPPGGSTAVVQNISSDGTTLVGYTLVSGHRQAALWTVDGGAQMLGTPEDWPDSTAHGVSGDGSLVVGWYKSPGDDSIRGFLWDRGHGMRDLQQVLERDPRLDLAGWLLCRGVAVSDDETVLVGTGLAPGATIPGAWRAVIPEPSSLVSLVSLLLAAAGICAARRLR